MISEKSFTKEWPETEYLFVDSGGYETNVIYDSSVD